MSILFSDLDNTLIYSHHRKINRPRMVVEHLNGREQSFMTVFTYGFLNTAGWLSVIPVTTRTEQQYNRIECTSKLRFKYAIVCNGGKLLVNSVEDKEWSHETYLRTQDKLGALEDASNQLQRICKTERIHKPEEYMVYVKCRDTEMVCRQLKEQVDTTKVTVQKDGRKVYIFANGVTKGSAVDRLMKRKTPETILAAGDGQMDISMLNIADYAFAKPEIYDLVHCQNRIRVEEDVFSDGICKYINTMRMKGIL